MRPVRTAVLTAFALMCAAAPPASAASAQEPLATSDLTLGPAPALDVVYVVQASPTPSISLAFMRAARGKMVDQTRIEQGAKFGTGTASPQATTEAAASPTTPRSPCATRMNSPVLALAQRITAEQPLVARFIPLTPCDRAGYTTEIRLAIHSIAGAHVT
ncbi:MAG: hypothetical protein JWN89_299 [Parcubacteria group bacterium]|nr:hypothetical protein [Parcubacteria group bacterium]